MPQGLRGIPQRPIPKNSPAPSSAQGVCGGGDAGGWRCGRGERRQILRRLGAGRAIGSGQVEGKAKTLGLRLKARGARWCKRNVRAMASLVCVRHSSQWEAYWAVAA